MSSSIIEHSDGSSLVLLTRENGESQVFDLAVNDSFEEADLIESESFHHYLVFSYSLLGEPNAGDAEDASEAEYAAEEFDSVDEHSFAGI